MRTLDTTCAWGTARFARDPRYRATLFAAAAVIVLGVASPGLAGERASGRVAPAVEIRSPVDGEESAADQVEVVIAFHADNPNHADRKRPVGNVRLVELYVTTAVGTELLAAQANPARVKTGLVIFVVDLASLPDGDVTLTAVAYQGSKQAALAGSHSVTIRIDHSPPHIVITSPANGTVTRANEILVFGRIDEPATVTVAGIPATMSALTFSATVPLKEGNRIIVVEAVDALGNRGTASVVVLRDTTPPRVSIASPTLRQVIYGDSTTVVGSVGDLVIGQVDAGDCSVVVNGVEASVASGGFLAFDVPIDQGPGSIIAIARDRAGNVATAAVTVIGDTRPQPLILPEPGARLVGVVERALAGRLVAQVVDVQGDPVAGVAVTFRVTRSNGSLDGGTRILTRVSNAAGEASTGFTFGSRAGVASDRVEATAPGHAGLAFFALTASGDPTPPHRMVAVGGLNQLAGTRALASMPLVIIITDLNGNPLIGKDVTFSRMAGDSKVNGGVTATVQSDSDGRAFALVTTGSQTGFNTQRFRATVPDADEVYFVISPFDAGPPEDTAVSGAVLTNQSQPIPGVKVTVGGTPLQMLTDAEGRFRLVGVPVGHMDLYVDGSVVTNPDGTSYPSLHFELSNVSGIDNTMDRPVYLPVLDQDGIAHASATQDAVITRQDMPGFKMEIARGSATFGDGSKSGAVQVIRVNVDKIPMPPSDGTFPRLAIAIKPPNVAFDPPARLSVPNVEGRPPGELVSIQSFDHDIGQFVLVGTAQVSEDGQRVVSEPGQGIIKGGWHLVPPEPQQSTCMASQCRNLICGASSCVYRFFANGQCRTSPTLALPATPPDTPDAGCYQPCPPTGAACVGGLCPPPLQLAPGTGCVRQYSGAAPLDFEPGAAGVCRIPTVDNPNFEPICCPANHWCSGADAGDACTVAVCSTNSNCIGGGASCN